MKKASQKAPRYAFALNGYSIRSLSVDNAGQLEVEFDLPQEQENDQWYTYRRGSRTFDIYEDEELEQACRELYELVRRRMQEPDPKRLAVHCDRCKTAACCRSYNVLVTDEDLERLARGLEMPLERLKMEYLVPAIDWCADFELQLASDEDENGEEKCVFLVRDHAAGLWRCSVYEHRPEACRRFDMKTCDDFVPIEDVRVIDRR
jgi:Fe-S-cluster containining protein